MADYAVANPPYGLIESANSCHGCTDQWPDAAPDGEANTKTIGESSAVGCLPNVIVLVGSPWNRLAAFLLVNAMVFGR